MQPTPLTTYSPHPTLYDALNGDLTEKVDSNTMGIFGTTPVGICPDYCSVESNETIEAKLWGQKMDNITGNPMWLIGNRAYQPKKLNN